MTVSWFVLGSRAIGVHRRPLERRKLLWSWPSHLFWG